MSRFTRSKRWLLVAALSSTAAAGCKNGSSPSSWNPFAKSGPTPNLIQDGDNLVQPNMPQPPSTESSWTAPFKKIGDTISSTFGSGDKAPSAYSVENDSISLANKVTEPQASLHVKIAKIHEGKGKWKEAVEEYDKALDIDSSDQSANLGLAQLYDRNANYELALVFYGRAAQVAPTNAAIQNDMGLCLARSGNMKDAATALRRAVSLDAKETKYRNNLATVLIELDRVDEAYETLETAHGAAVAHYNVGFLLNKKNRKAEALKHFEQSAALDPSLMEARQWIAALGGAASSEPATTASLFAPKSSHVAKVEPATELTTTPSASVDPAPASTTKPTPVPADFVRPEPEPTLGPALPSTTKTTPAAAAAQPGAQVAANGELTNLPRRPTIAGRQEPALVAQVDKPAPTVAATAATFDKLPAKNDPAVTPAGSSDANRYPTAAVPSTPLPRAAVVSDAVPPLPEQISTFDVPESKNAKPAAPRSTLAEPKYPASRY